MKEKTKELFKKGKWLRSTLLTMLLIVIIIAIYTVLNIYVRSLKIANIDITKDKLYSLSQESIDKVKSVNQDTKIIAYGMSDYPAIEEYANLYNKQNSHITYEELTDVSKRPDLQSDYALGSGISSLVIVETENRKKAVMTSDLTTYDNTTYEQIDITEQALTNAILAVNLEKTPSIYLVTNHVQYTDQYTVFEEYLKNEANTVNSLDLLVNGKVPDDCDVLVLTTLKEDFSEYERDLIIDYINKGGNLLILADPNIQGVDLANFNKILEQYGVEESNEVVFEGSTSSMLSGYPNFVIPQVSDSSEITKYISSDGAVALLNAGKLTFKSDEELESLGVTTENLITATSSSFLRNDLTISSTTRIDADKDAAGAVIGAIATKKIKVNEEEKTSKAVIFANSVFASDLSIQLYGTSSNSQSRVMGISFYNNRDLALNSVSYLTQRTDNITVRKDTGTISTFTATEQQKIIIQIIIISIPALILLAGIIVWQVRRRKK